MTEQFCRATFEENKVRFDGASSSSHTDINEVIKDDKRYGIFKPRNGKYFTFRVIDVLDTEITEKQVITAVHSAFRSWTKRINITVKKAKTGEYADFRLMFRTPENDERKHMKERTIMYHHYPISAYDSPNRGLCVINPNFYYTANGKPVSMHLIDPVNYSKDTKIKGKTIDFDAVLRHEFGHGLGLPHDPEDGNTMSTPYSSLNEWLADRDVMRGIAKYGIKKMPLRIFLRWLRFNKHRSENY